MMTIDLDQMKDYKNKTLEELLSIRVRNELGPIDQKDVDLFIQATQGLTSEHQKTLPLTYSAVLKRSEFIIIESLNIDLTHILHTDAEFEYYQNFNIGDTVTVFSFISEYKKRKNIKLLSIQSEVYKKSDLCQKTINRFLVRM